MKIKNVFKNLVMATTLAASVASAQTPYDEGQKALREQHWMEAARHFAEAARVPGAESDRIAAAMYWRAHALYKADHRGDAARQVSELERNYPASRWLAEARALQVEYQGSIEDAGAEDELRVFALSQLMERDLERALPLLINIMRETRSEQARRDAMFVLGMSDSPAAQQAIAEAARDSADPEMQAQAIEMLGAASSDTALSMLGGLYTGSTDKQVKEAVIHAYIAADSAEPLLGILKTETDPDLQREIIHALGAMGETEALHELYPGLSSRETRMAAIESFAIAQDDDMLRELLNSETDPELRQTAIQGIAIAEEDDASEFLQSLYANTSNHEEKVAILESLAILDDAEGLALQIVNTERDPELLALAINMLGVMGATESLAGLYERYDDVETRRTVLESMAIAGDTEGLKQVIRQEQDPELRASAIESIAIDGGADAGEFLVGLYDGSSETEKQSIINSMMILEDAPALIALLEREKDPQMRRQMLQVLTMMDSDEASEYLFKMLEEGG